MGCRERLLHTATIPFRYFSHLIGHKLAHIYLILIFIIVSIVLLFIYEETETFGQIEAALEISSETLTKHSCSLSCVFNWIKENPIIVCLMCPAIGLLIHFALGASSTKKTNSKSAKTPNAETNEVPGKRTFSLVG
jgi:hypothetical protein